MRHTLWAGRTRAACAILGAGAFALAGCADMQPGGRPPNMGGGYG